MGAKLKCRILLFGHLGIRHSPNFSVFFQKVKSVLIKKVVLGTYRVRVNKPCTAPEEATASKKRRRAKWRILTSILSFLIPLKRGKNVGWPLCHLGKRFFFFCCVKKNYHFESVKNWSTLFQQSPVKPQPTGAFYQWFPFKRTAPQFFTASLYHLCLSSLIFIGPRSDHSLPMSVTHWLTNWRPCWRLNELTFAEYAEYAENAE